MMLRDKIVEHARHWIDTPYLHQASCRGAGCDCLGLLRGIWREIYGDEPEKIPSYTKDWNEPQGDEILLQRARKHLLEKPVEAMAVGDALVFRMRQGMVAKHLGILSQEGENAKFIHAYSGHGVIENALSEPWRRRIAACFSFPEIGDL